MQYADVIALLFETANDRDDSAESAGIAILDGIDSIGIVEMNECERAGRVLLLPPRAIWLKVTSAPPSLRAGDRLFLIQS